jgi:hypothetical protein
MEARTYKNQKKLEKVMVAKPMEEIIYVSKNGIL